MEYISTSALAYELDIKPNELFEKLKTLGWITRKFDKWILTDLGRKKGGQTRYLPNNVDYVVWPEDISIDNENEKPTFKTKLLNATTIGKHYDISSQRLNLILSELGWIEKAFVGQHVNGWAVTKLGKSIGGKQFEHETSGGSYVLWPGSIMQNKSLKDVFNANQAEKEPPAQISNTPQQKEPVQQSFADYRDKWPANHRALDGHYVRSNGEMIIDNLLYQYGLVHAYERKIFIGEEEILSDFYLPGGKVYIEFWGMVGDPKYDERKKKKIEFYRKNEIPLIEIHKDDLLSLDDHLPKQLKNFGIKVY
jgi:hypothetical protein